MTEPFAPTAASASPPAKFPTTATSAALNNCCKILLAAKGNANNNSLSQIDPFYISIFFIQYPISVRIYYHLEYTLSQGTFLKVMQILNQSSKKVKKRKVAK